MSVRAPGKAMLFGEYAVLDGAPAIVAAVDRYAVAALAEAVDPPTPFVAHAAEKARERLAADGRAAPRGTPVVDSTALHAGGRKLGLGSSAAVTVAAHGAVLHAAGVDLDVEKQRIFAACDAAHRAAQGVAGSGADVAAAVWGGVLLFRRDEGAADQPVSGVAWPASVAITLVDTGVPASTADRVARYRDAAARRPDEHRALVAKMRVLALSVAGRGVPVELAALVAEWNACLAELARLIDREIVTPAHRRIDERARALGGSAKPSGAGGGDLAVCFTPHDAVGRLRAQLASEGFDPLDLHIGAPGLSPVATENR